MSTSDLVGDKTGPGSKMQGTGTSSGGGGGATAGTGSGGPGSTTTATAYPIDLASASKVLVRPTNEKTNVPTTYRIGNSAGNQMRVVIPSNAASQTFYRHSINLKQDTTTNRAQITALPARTVTQTSITVSRPQTPTTYQIPARVPTTVATIQGPRATITAPIRIPTPPISVANLSTYVRQTVPSRTSSPSATIISQGNTWMPTNVQVQVPTQLIRANSITQAPRARVVAQTIPVNQSSSSVNNATITANVVAHPSSTQANQQNVSISGTNPSQAFVATLATAVLPPQKQFTSTLVYTNNNAQQPYTSGTNPQRLTLAATTLSPQRPTGVRPIQRLPTNNLPQVRVTAGSISIRTPSVPVLAPPTVLTTIAPGTAGTQSRTTSVSTTNTIPARIIQVQNPQSGQIISGRSLPTNLVNIQPLLVSNNRIPHSNIQPSLTIAQVGKLTPVAASPVSNSSGSTSTQDSISGGGTTTLQTASGQQIVVSSSQVGSGGLSSSAGSGSTATIITGNLISNQSGGGSGQSQSQGQITQIVNVNAGSVGSGLSGQAPQIVTVSQGQVISTQQALSVSNSGGSGSTTVIPIPLAITGGRNATIPVSVATLSGGQNPISIVSGGSTITGIVRTTTSGTGGGGGSLSTSSMPSILPIAKVTPQQLSSLSTIEAVSSSAPYSVSGSGTSLYIQTRPQPPSAIVTTVASTGKSSTLNVVSGSSSGSLGNSTLYPTSTLYYERVTASPASSSSQPTTTPSSGAIGLVQSVSALTSTTITTTSAVSGPVFSISSSALSSGSGTSTGSVTGTIVSGVSSSGPLSSSNANTTTVSSLPYAPAPGSFAIVQTSGRNISGPIHGIVSSAGTITGQSGPFQSQQQQSQSQQQSTAAQIQAVPVRFHPQLLVDGGQAQQIIMTGTSASSSSSSVGQQQPAHMLIPVNPVGGKLESPQSSILRKRGASPLKSKDLTQTLMAIGKERAREMEQQRERDRERDMSPPSRPASTDGSTTVSATSSPGIDQQEQEEIKAMAYANRNANSDLPFKPVHEEIFHLNQQPQSQSALEPPQHSFHHPSIQQLQNAATGGSGSSNGNYEQSPRKKPRKQNVSEGLKSVANSLQFYANNELDNSYRMDTSGPAPMPPSTADTGFGSQQQQQHQSVQPVHHPKHGVVASASASAAAINSAVAAVNNLSVASNSVKMDGVQVAGAASGVKEVGAVGAAAAAAVPKDASSVRKPRNVSLLESYKQSWKAANNHFQRYTDVKQREERRQTIVDISNQSHVLQKVNGWKIYHLSAQIEDLCELESQAYDKLDQMLKTMEATPKPSAEIERVNDLLKGNMQRSKIIIDGINEARTQIMKIFDHKTHVSDIIQRCASKRNFKKREKS